jgi:serine/threonine-protein kinase
MPDEKLGKYEIRGQLGKGAMGTVLDGWDPILLRRVAIKTVNLPAGSDSEAQDDLARFMREAQAAGRLTHPNIVGAYDYGETDKVAYIVMEFVDGRTLKDVLDKKEVMPLMAVVRVMDDLLAGLQYSHDRGVVHRDIKPANVMLTKEGQAKIADFGIARIENSSLTQAGTVLGTPAYMSPEQFMGQVVDLRTDIYSSGVLLYQLLTGERPFEGSMTSIMHKVLNVPPPKPSALSVTCPPGFDVVVARAMAKRPDDRFPSAAAFAEAIRAAQAAPVAAAADPLGEPDPLADEGTVVMSGPARAAVDATISRPPTRPDPVPTAAKREEQQKGGGGKIAAIGIAAAVVLAALGGGAYYEFGGTSTGGSSVRLADNGGGGAGDKPPSTAPTATLPPITNVAPSKPPVSPPPVTLSQAANIAPAKPPAAPPTVAPTRVVNTEPTQTPTTPPKPSLPPITNVEPAKPPSNTSSLPPIANVEPVKPPSNTSSLPPIANAEPVKPPSSADTTPPPIAPPPIPNVAPVAPPTIRVNTNPPVIAPPPIAPSPIANVEPVKPPPNPPSDTSPPPVANVEQPKSPQVLAMVTQRSPAEIRSDIEAAIKATPCAILADYVSDRSITVEGAASADSVAKLRATIDSVGPGETVQWQVRVINTQYCRALDIVRPIAVVGRAGGFAVKTDKLPLVENDYIQPRVTLPDWSAHLQVVYVANDNSILYITPNKVYPDTAYAPRSAQVFGAPRADFAGWQVGSPFGTDMIIAVASSTSLMPPRAAALTKDSAEENATPFLDDLQAAIERAERRPGTRLTASVFFVDTVAAPKP